MPVRGDRAVTAGNFTALGAMPARYVPERDDWLGAAALPITSSRFLHADSLTRFSRGLCMVRAGDAAGAKREIEAIEALRGALQKSDQAYWANRSDEQILTVSAWVALKEGNPVQAAKLMRSAADGEDGNVKSPQMENRLYPVREPLGELLMEAGQGGAAPQEFGRAIKAYPNGHRGYWGAALAARAAG